MSITWNTIALKQTKLCSYKPIILHIDQKNMAKQLRIASEFSQILLMETRLIFYRQGMPQKEGKYLMQVVLHMRLVGVDTKATKPRKRNWQTSANSRVRCQQISPPQPDTDARVRCHQLSPPQLDSDAGWDPKWAKDEIFTTTRKSLMHKVIQIRVVDYRYYELQKELQLQQITHHTINFWL